VRKRSAVDFVYKNIKLAALLLISGSMRQSDAEAANSVQIERINDLWAYVLPDDKLVTGSSYGNKKCFANSKATGAIESLFSLDLGRNVIGSTLRPLLRRGIRRVARTDRHRRFHNSSGVSKTHVQTRPRTPRFRDLLCAKCAAGSILTSVPLLI
jgi:hypothetical protein